jgi:L-threonylcarbamoyladenylate synthase
MNAHALASIFELKQRPFFDPLIVHLEDMAWVEKLCAATPPQARLLMERFWPGPLTLVLPKRPLVPDLATAGLPNVAVRMPAHPAARALIRAAGTPLAAPSANPFGRLIPTCAEHVSAAFDRGIACILDGGPCAVGVESTVLGFLNGEPRLLRLGGVALEELESALGRGIATMPQGERPLSPGALPWHYAPRTPLTAMEKEKIPPPDAGCGLLWFGDETPPAGFAQVENPAPDGNMQSAAAGFFASLHRLDQAGLKRIVARLLPESGLGRAINDRLRKASARP